MDIYLKSFLLGALMIGGIATLLWIMLSKSKGKQSLHTRDASLSSEQLEHFAMKTATTHAVSRNQTFKSWPLRRVNDNYEFILSVYQDLNEDTHKKLAVPASAAWLLDNFHTIEEQVKGMRHDLVKSQYLKLPILSSGQLKGQPRILAIAVELVAHTDGNIDDAILRDYLLAYQSNNVLCNNEVWSLPIAVKLALLENIRHLCETIKITQKHWHEADEVYNHWMKNENDGDIQLMKPLKEKLRAMHVMNPSFIEHLFYRLRQSGRSYLKFLKLMDECLVELGDTTEHITQKEHQFQSVETQSMGNTMTSLHYFSVFDWTELFDLVSRIEQILKDDPDGTYIEMDASTRNHYRNKVEFWANAFGVSEQHIAKEAIALAKSANSNHEEHHNQDNATQRTWHVGYYLMGEGTKQLQQRQKEYKGIKKYTKTNNRFLGLLYLGSIASITFILVAFAVQYASLVSQSHTLLLAVLAGIIVIIPSSEIAIHLVNWICCKAVKPFVFPRLDLKHGVPKHLSTLVVIPTLLSDRDRVAELLAHLEGNYLGNREENVSFVLVGAFRDSDEEGMKDNQQIIEAALHGIRALNQTYANEKQDKFYFFHRDSQFNEQNNKWIGWERKRGALMEFNDLVLGEKNTSFSVFSHKNPDFSNVKYIITLDSDTILPMGMAKKMIGTMAHPLNAPIVDKHRGVVVDGYGLMQPRIEVDSESSNQSLFARIFTGQEGIDPYANAISDVYQDMFGEGIFTGKGIYDLRVFQSVLKHAIPENTILSHDLLEGSYVRTGLVTDLRLVDSFPSQYQSYATRQFRWVRGDWQLVPLLFAKIFNDSHRKIANPLSLLSKWKMVDNLRRSLVAPSLMVLLFFSFCFLPGNLYFWISYLIVAIFFPVIVALIASLFSVNIGKIRTKRHMSVMGGFKTPFLQGLLSFVLLPYQAWQMVEAIAITLVRVFITRKNLLEWVTSADSDKRQKNGRWNYCIRMLPSLWVIPVLLVFALRLKPETVLPSIPMLLLWLGSPWIAHFVSQDIIDQPLALEEEQIIELGRIARKTWRYFEEFTTSKNHNLIPDNYQVEPPRGIAHRTSPTNIGFGLLSTLTARDMGYLDTSVMIDLIQKTITTMESMEKWNGHLFNWYDTLTLEPLTPIYVSTVDSGNLVGYLITLTQGLTAYLDETLMGSELYGGIRDTLAAAEVDNLSYYTNLLALPDSFNLVAWNSLLHQIIQERWSDDIKNNAWKMKFDRMIQQFAWTLSHLLPGVSYLLTMPSALLETQDVQLSSKIASLRLLLEKNVVLSVLPNTHRNAIFCLNEIATIATKQNIILDDNAMAWLSQLKASLETAVTMLKQLHNQGMDLIQRVRSLSDAMAFLPLYDKKKQLFSIGYDVTENKLSNSYYDLLASEARQASYVAIARGEIPASHWFRLGRSLTVMDHYKGLVSWTGTMFEYLMPLLIMKRYKNTLLDETYSFVIKSQKKYGKQKHMPWGISESGYHSMDVNLDYQYKAIGVPWLGLKRGLSEDMVAAPYATMLALLVDPKAAIENMEFLKAEGLEGAYGFYEAADYTPKRLLFESKRAIVKSFMAHHQGMALLAINNFLNHNIMQVRFHSDPAIHAARLLLQEKVPANLIFSNELKVKLPSFHDEATLIESTQRVFQAPDPMLPKVHILSNGNFSLAITDRGTGFSKTNMVSVNRWRADNVLDSYGMFFYLRNVEADEVWSATYAPMNVMPEQYEVLFLADKAVFMRVNGDVRTKTEVIVASGDNTEVRRISLTNYGTHACTMEITSYMELVLATQESDVAHAAFSNLFIETEYHQDRHCIIAKRRPRSEHDKTMWIASSVVMDELSAYDLQYETDRMQLIGRGGTPKNPMIIAQNKPLSNTVGTVLDPVLSLRTSIVIEPGKTRTISYVTSLSENNELLLSLVDKYATSNAIEAAFGLALTRSQVETKYMNLSGLETVLYQDMISHILFASPSRRSNASMLLQNTKGQSSLWKYSISGDCPIILVVLKKANQMELLYEVLKAHEYWCFMNLRVDLVVLSEEENNYLLPLHALIADIVSARQEHDMQYKRKDMYLMDINQLQVEDIPLLYAAARMVFQGGAGTMRDQMSAIKTTVLPPVSSFAPLSQDLLAYENVATEIQELQYWNGLGGFHRDGNEYWIELKKGQTTPAPWVNVIANPNFGFVVSESGSGYTWYENSREYKITPWSNDVVSDSPGEVIYIGDEMGQTWTMGALPIREDESYTACHGFGYSVFEHTSHGMQQSLTQFVAVKDAVKISLLEVKNSTNKVRNLTLTYYIQPVLGVNAQATALHLKSSVGSSGALLLENPYNEEFSGKICFVDASIKERGITCDRKEFFGWGDIAAPDGLCRDSFSETTGVGFDQCGVIQIKLTLLPHESKKVVFLLGVGESLIDVDELTCNYRSVGQAEHALQEVKKFWHEKLAMIQVKTPVASTNLMLNGWLQYQVISCRLWARCGFYQSGGAFGFRDQLQDSLSMAQLWPSLTKAQILLHAQHQYIEGDVQHWWHEPNGKGTRTRFSDDRLWLPFVCVKYVEITGDQALWQELAPFVEDRPLAANEDERYGQPMISSEVASIYEHCVRAIDISLKFGIHGLPLMGSGDWNDGMNTVGNKGTGESVWLAWFIATVLEGMIPICRQMDDGLRADSYERTRVQIVAAIEASAWDGKWYMRAFFDDGTPLGSNQNTNGKIDSIAQSWSVINGSGDPQRARQAMKSLEDYLIQWEDGLVKLLFPPFDEGAEEPGYIKGYVPGVRENGGQYTHAAIWAIMAFAKLGDGDKASKLFELINPINHTRSIRDCGRYKAEPYVMAADVYAVHPHMGRGGWSWYTGAAGWMYRAGIESILGFQKKGEMIVIDPCIPSDWNEYSIHYQYISTKYNITVKNPNNVQRGVVRIIMDGIEMANNTIPLTDDCLIHIVEVEMGHDGFGLS